tara:strand:+ start:280 stop:717 length:438 start_codon:yes stop_codon:yes gene_type:complete
MTITSTPITRVDSSDIGVDIEIDTDNDFNNQNLTIPERIIGFVDAVGDILEELPPDGFKKMLQYTTQTAYSFAGQSLTLADCMNTLIRDYNSIKNTHPRVGYYYNAMCFEFLQRSLLVVGADPERITELDTRITEEFNKFKGISV